MVVCCCALHADRYVAATLIDDAPEIGDLEPCSKVKTKHATLAYTYRQEIDYRLQTASEEKGITNICRGQGRKVIT